MTRRTARGADPVIGAELADALAQALAPVDPPPARSALLLDRVLAVARPDPARDYVTVPESEDGWQPLIEGIRMKVLHESPTHRFALYRLAPGAVFPAHTHPFEEECLVLEGDLSAGGVRMTAGDFQYAREGSIHDVLRSDGGALVYLRHAIDSRPLPP